MRDAPIRTTRAAADRVLNDSLHPIDAIALQLMIERGMVEIVDNEEKT